MFDITKENIKSLRDDELRELVALLCDAELALQGISNVGVTRGGDQDAKDGGIDVRVEVEALILDNNYIPKTNTGYQVKKPNLRPADIQREMRPNDTLRPAIIDLAKNEGAYIIVSSSADLTDSMLQNRLKAMKDALDGLELRVDFYDQERLKTWTNNHLGLVYWVKSKLGKPLKGWRPFGNWTYVETKNPDQYVIDDGLEIKTLGAAKSNKIDSRGNLKGIDGLEHIRDTLRSPCSSVRLVGLSGVGKTRFAQALFEPDIGKTALSSTIAIYTDVSDNPVPHPTDLLLHLSLQGLRVIMIVDNCGRELHRSLTEKLSSENSQISLLTIEYDVRENLPSATSAFQLEPASSDLISKVLRNRFSHLNYAATERITRLAGGNYRIALLLAEQIKSNENVSEITDTVLFERIFMQGNEANHDLLRVAEVLSIVYSFDFGAFTEDSEISILGNLTGFSPNQMYGQVAELERRKLVQARSKWRAILPHALANRLARRCLENIPPDLIKDIINNPSNFRLLKSVSRRLNYLKDHEIASYLTKDWCDPGNLLSQPLSLDKDHIEILKNITSIHEDTVLGVLEKAISICTLTEYNECRHRNELIKITIYIAYDPVFFIRCIKLLVRCYLLEHDEKEKRNLRENISKFFQAILSGTNATIGQRIEILNVIWLNNDLFELQLAEECLSAGLKVSNFYGHPVFDYDHARNDFGYQPKSWKETEKWFHSYIELVLELYHTKNLEAPIHILANHFRGFWKLTKLRPYLIASVENILSKGSWIQGWVAVGEALQYDRKEIGVDSLQQLEILFERLMPSDLLDQIRVYVLMEAGNVYQEITGEEKGRSRSREEVNRIAENLGFSAANNLELLTPLVAKLLNCRVPNSLYAFGLGVGKQCSAQNRIQLWQIVRDALVKFRGTLSYTLFVQGYIAGTKTIATSFIEQLLDDMLDDSEIVRFFPAIQGAAGYDEKGIQRLLISLESDNVPIRAYSQLAYENNTIANGDLIEILEKILTKHHGIRICIDVLNFRVNKNDLYVDHNSDLLAFVFKVVKAYDFSSPEPDWHHDGDIYDLKHLLDKCFASSLAYNPSVALLNNFKSYYREQHIKPLNIEIITGVLIKHQPLAVLDTLVNEEPISESYWEDFRSIRNFSLMISALPNELLLEWCQQGSIERYHRLARYINPIDNKLATINYEKWVKLVTVLIENGEKDKVLSEISSSLFSSTGKGLSIFGLSSYRNFLSQLVEIIPDLEEWVNKEQVEIKKVWEMLNNRDFDWGNDTTPQSFE